MNQSNIMVSVCMITYNHESYISKAIESVLMQNTTFQIELIIGEDCSTDKTRQICLDYKKKFPDIIKLILPDVNLGVMRNFVNTLNAGKGNYIAICEGDDYWTDTLKLQKQVELMEAKEKYSFCFHNAETHFIDTNRFESFNKNLKFGTYTTNDLLYKEWFIPTASMLIRRTMLPNPFPKWFFNVYSGDYALELLLSTRGDFYYINQIMSVYRKNAINSQSVVGDQGVKRLDKHLYLLRNFKTQNIGKNYFANNLAIANTVFKKLRVYIYSYFPFIASFKDKLLHN